MSDISVKVGRKNITVKQNIIDKTVSYFNPVKGQERLKSRMMMALSGGGYNGGKRSSRVMKGRSVTSGDADSDLLPDLAALREYSRDLVRNTPLAAGAINTAVTNVVGTGLKVHPSIDARYLGLNKEQVDTFQTNAKREFSLFADSQECDAARTLNFYGHQEMAFRSSLENGDIFYLLPYIERPGSLFGLKLQAVEADRVENEDFARDTTELAGGIKTDQHGAPTEYHILKSHPGNVSRSNQEWHKVKAFGKKTGRRNVLHLFDQRRPGQRRGAPYLSPVIESLRQLGRYTDAELMAAIVSGMFTVFVHTENGDGLESTGTGDDGNEEYEMGNGSIVSLGENEKIETANPGRPNGGFDPFVMSILRQIGSALEIPFELLIKHFTSSYSASKAAFLEAWKFFKKRRGWLVTYFCQPVYEAVIWEAVASGRLYAPGFLEDERVRKAYLRTIWTGPGKGQINELQEAKAQSERLASGVTTLDQETAEYNGGDWDVNHQQSAKEYKARSEAGLIEKNQFPELIDDSPDKQDDDDKAA